jgi:hypothetical protein
MTLSFLRWRVTGRLLSIEMVLFLSWLTLVIFEVSHHAVWRDEVRALSIVIDANNNIFDLIHTAGRDGHPFVWYVLIDLARQIFHSSAVLPAISVIIAAGAVVIFLFWSPFSTTFKALFVFSDICLSEYSVIARNYGISMLLMFVFAALYKAESRQPIILGIVLLLLANTNAHSMLLVPFFLCFWVWQSIDDSRKNCTTEGVGALSAGWALALAGIIFCIVTIYPSPDSLYVRSVTSQEWRVLHDHSLVETVVRVMVFPGVVYGDLFPLGAPHRMYVAASSVVLFAGVAGFLYRPPLLLAALGGLWANSLLFALIYGGGYRHQMIWVVFLVTLYWIAIDGQPASPMKGRADRPLALGIRVVLPVILIAQVKTSVLNLYAQASHPWSMSMSAADLLHKTAGMEQAIVMAEPDYLVESLPYYLSNPTYLLRDARFGKTSSFKRSAKLDLRLADILAQAQRLRADYGRPVIILLYHRLDQTAAETVHYDTHAWTFRYTPREVSDFLAATTKLASLRGSLSEEDYDVYVLN